MISSRNEAFHPFYRQDIYIDEISNILFSDVNIVYLYKGDPFSVICNRYLHLSVTFYLLTAVNK